jgi:hypothetical protein
MKAKLRGQLRDGWLVGETAEPELQPYEAMKR